MCCARTDDQWEPGDDDTYIKTIKDNGYNVLINGVNRYLNFNNLSGVSGYGLRDNSGIIEIKNSGGAWTPVGGGSISWIDLTGTPIALLLDQTNQQEVINNPVKSREGFEMINHDPSAVAVVNPITFGFCSYNNGIKTRTLTDWLDVNSSYARTQGCMWYDLPGYTGQGNQTINPDGTYSYDFTVTEDCNMPDLIDNSGGMKIYAMLRESQIFGPFPYALKTYFEEPFKETHGGPKAYTDWLYTMALLWKGKGVAYTIDNEVGYNFQKIITHKLNPQWNATAHNYAALQKMSYKTIKSADPLAKVVYNDPLGVQNPNTDYNPFHSIDAMLELNAGNYFDVYCLHFYGAHEWINTFTVSGITVAPLINDHYSNNGVNYKITKTDLTGVTGSISGTITCVNASPPETSGDLTKISGSGDATIAFSSATSVLTFLWPQWDYYTWDMIADGINDRLTAYKLTKEMWIGESGVGTGLPDDIDGNPNPDWVANCENQALEFIKDKCEFASKGYTNVMSALMEDSLDYTNSGDWRSTGLITSPDLNAPYASMNKPSYDIYKELTDVLKGCTFVSVSESGGVKVFRFTCATYDLYIGYANITGTQDINITLDRNYVSGVRHNFMTAEEHTLTGLTSGATLTSVTSTILPKYFKLMK